MVPSMRMGLVGFTPEESDNLSNLLSKHSITLKWERWPFMEADALWVNGAHAQLNKDQLVRIPSQDPTKPAILLDLKEIDRPTSFTLPMMSTGVNPPHVFDPTSAVSLVNILRKFEAWLQPLAVQLTLCQGLADRRQGLDSPVYHLTLGGKLLAVLCAQGDVGLAPGVTPAEVAAATWGGRPRAAGGIPSHFTRSTMPQMMWQFALRTQEDLLPRRYRNLPIHFRRMPPVPHIMLREVHRMLLAQLMQGADTFDQLRQQTGLAELPLAQALAALYLAGSITTDPKRAAANARRQDNGRSAPFDSSYLLESGFRASPDDPTGLLHATAPAPLTTGSR
jgi:hypothetical protein